MDRVELEREMERLHPASFGWAMACCNRRRDQAEDVLQTTYLKVLSGKARFDGRARFKTWLFAVIRRTAAEHSRRSLLRFFGLELAVNREGRAIRADVDMERSEAVKDLLGALMKLARRQREVLELVFYHDMTIEEAAKVMRVTIGTARVHYERGKKRLQQKLAGRIDSCEVFGE